MAGPIRPEDVNTRKSARIPQQVFEVFNRLIARQWDGHSATVRQSEVVRLLIEAGFERAQIFAERMLDVESAYEAAGWKVVYDKPGYNESYPATFTFSKKRG
jgi:hypothetical protein